MQQAPAAEPSTPIGVALDVADHGGAEVVLTSLIAGWRAQGHPVFVVCPSDRRLTQRLAALGAQVAPVPGLRRHPAPGAARRVTAAFRSAGVERVLVSLTDQGDGAALLRAVRALPGPSLGLLNLWVPGRARWRDRISRSSLGGVPVVVPSSSTREMAGDRQIGSDVVPLAPPAVPMLSRDAARRELGLPRDAPVVGGIGRLTSQKGWDVLAAAAPLIQQRLPSARFAVVGDGPQLRRLERLGQGRISFVGYRDDAARLMPGFDLLVAPSRYESLGFTVVEAARAGVPIVATDTVGLRDTARELGSLVPPEDPKALADAVLATLTGSADQPTGAGLQRLVAGRYDVDTMVSEISGRLGLAADHRVTPGT